MSPRSLWIVLTRPDNLPNALAVAGALRDRFPGGAYLLREPSAWWERADWETLRARFADVYDFARIETCRGLRDLPRLVRETRARQRALETLPAGPRDVAVCLAGLVGLANAVATAWRTAGRPRPTLVVPKKKYDDLRQPVDCRRFRWTAPGWLQNRFVEPLVGLHRTVHLKPRRRAGGDGVRLVRYEAEPEDVFGSVLLLSYAGNKPHAADSTDPMTTSVCTASFPNLATLADELGLEGPREETMSSARRSRVLFFGTPFLLVRNLAPEVYAAGLDRCLDYLRRHYGDHCELVYRPHPAETGESAQLRLDGFRVEDDREVAELHFLKEGRSIAAVYSVSSTVSRAALQAGLNAYCLWRTFPFSPTNATYFETLMGAVPPGFDVYDLSVPPVAYAGTDREKAPGMTAAASHGPTFVEVLREAVG